MTDRSRRRFLKGSAVLSGAVAFRPGSLLASSLVQDARPTRLSEFNYADVQLLDGPMLEQFRTNHTFFLALDNDALLKPFRQPLGLPAPGEDMGGWYSWSKDFDPPSNMTGYVPGHSFGQYLSGLARAYAITGNKRTQEKVLQLVRGFAATISPKFYANYPLPCYTFDKTNCGLIDAHQFAADPMALPALSHATDAVMPYLPPKALTRPEMMQRPHPNIAFTWDESYTLPENFFLAYKRSNNPRYLKLARRFLQDDSYFNPLAEGQNVLPGLHAYSHVNALSSASQAYLVTGSEKHLLAARNGFEFVRDTQSFATGGWGPNETFRAPGSGEIGESLTKTHASFETPCGAYGHFKIARYLLRISGDSRYGDSMEKVLYNTILGAKPIRQDGHSFYYSDYNNSGSKFYHPDKWPCCSGTFPQITADYGISSYFRGDRGVYVNLYVPSKGSWRQNSARCSLVQHTDYPNRPTTALHIYMDRPERYAVYLRIPAWAGSKTTVAVNGRKHPGEIPPGAFLPLERIWKNGDRIELTLDMPVRIEAVDSQHPKTVAVLSGPVVLFAIGDTPGRITTSQLRSARQVSSGSTDWYVATDNGNMRMLPFAAIGDEKYRTYHTVQT